MGLLVSFTADAGHDASIGASRALLSSRPAPMPLDLMGFAPGGRKAFPLHMAALAVGDAQDLLAPSDEIEPRRDIKHNVSAFPAPDRSRKGDPAIGLRPTFDAKLRQPGGLAAARLDDLLFSTRDYLAFSGFAQGSLEPPDEARGFADGSGVYASGATAPAAGAHSPGGGGSIPAMVAASPMTFRSHDGATPSAPRAVALGSTSPAPLDQAPLEIVAIPYSPESNALSSPAVKAPSGGAIARGPARPDYAALIDQDRARQEERCLAEAIYFEARSEPEAGQAAVAQVVLNRVQSGLYPASICGAVYQNRHRHLACQFSFACEGKSLRITEPEPWRAAVRIAGEVLSGKTYLSDVGASTHYHANYVRPGWAKALKKTDTIGTHVFYKLRPGQT